MKTESQYLTENIRASCLFDSNQFSSYHIMNVIYRFLERNIIYSRLGFGMFFNSKGNLRRRVIIKMDILHNLTSFDIEFTINSYVKYLEGYLIDENTLRKIQEVMELH